MKYIGLQELIRWCIEFSGPLWHFICGCKKSLLLCVCVCVWYNCFTGVIPGSFMEIYWHHSMSGHRVPLPLLKWKDEPVPQRTKTLLPSPWSHLPQPCQPHKEDICWRVGWHIKFPSGLNLDHIWIASKTPPQNQANQPLKTSLCSHCMEYCSCMNTPLKRKCKGTNSSKEWVGSGEIGAIVEKTLLSFYRNHSCSLQID